MTVDLILVMASSEQGPYLLERKEPMDKWNKTDVESVAEINLYDIMNHILNRGNFTKHWNEIYPPYCEGKLHQIGMPLFSFLWVLYDSVAFFRFLTSSPSNQDTEGTRLCECNKMCLDWSALLNGIFLTLRYTEHFEGLPFVRPLQLQNSAIWRKVPIQSP